MNPDASLREAPRRHLFVPMMPTPNGALHLGHISGPYLKVDILARALRQRGDEVALITTSDAFESHVLESAGKHGVSARATCDRFHEEIRADFEFMNIRFDAFINVFREPWNRPYHETHVSLANALLARGRASNVKERYLFDETSSEPLLGFRLSGKCPNCSNETVGFVCENCGRQVTTEMLDSPGGTASGKSLSWRSGDTLALRVDDPEAMAAKITATNLPSEFKQAMTSFIADPLNIIRLTVLGEHGVGPYRHDGMTYTLYNTYFGHAVFCGQVYAEMFGLSHNAFAIGSEVVTVTSCGLDNATDLTATMASADAHGDFKGFDHHLGNFFLTLDGRKFSTSQRHAVFVSEVRDSPAVDVDALRFYLAQISPQQWVTNFDVEEFLSFYNDWFVGFFCARVNRARHAIVSDGVEPPSQAFCEQFRATLAARHEALRLEALALGDYAGLIRNYCAHHGGNLEASSDAYWWLKSLSLLAFPVMPDICRHLWRSLACPEDPAIDDFFAIPPLALSAGDLVRRLPLTRADLHWPAAMNSSSE